VIADFKSLGNHWDSVDLVGSSSLSGLLEALKIECESKIPSLDLTLPDPAGALLPAKEEESYDEVNGDIDAEEWVDSSMGPNSKDLARYSREIFQRSDLFPTNSNLGLGELSFSEWSFREWDFSRNQPPKLNISHIIGLSPFPALSDTSLHRTLHHENSSLSARSQFWQDKEIEQKYRVQKLKKLLGGENLNTIAAMEELGSIYSNQYKYRQAERLYRQIAISYKKTLGFKHVSTLRAYLEVVNLLCNQGELRQALKIHDFIHNTIIQLVALDDSLALESNSARTFLICQYNKFDEADKLIRQTLQIEFHTLGPWRKETLYDMNILSRILKCSKKLDESEQLIRITQHLYQVLEGPFSRKSLESLAILLDVLEAQGRYDECRNLAMTIVERFSTLVGPERGNILYCFYVAATCARKQGDLLESELLTRSVLAQQIEIFGEKHPNTYLFWTELSITLGSMGRHSEAATLLERSYEGFVRSFGMSLEDTIWSCRLLGEAYVKLGRYEDVVELLQRAISEAWKHAEKPTKYLLKAISHFGVLFRKAGRYVEAMTFQEECLRGCLEIYGSSGGGTIYTIDQLGLCYEGLGRYNDAFALYQKSIDQIRILEGDEHPALVEISGFITALQEVLAASDEEDGESQLGSDSTETTVEKALIDEQNGDMDDRLAKEVVPPSEEDWMGEFVDFGSLENTLPGTETSSEDAQGNEM
jgi:tetratricopeptide (TPR) repeat protein